MDSNILASPQSLVEVIKGATSQVLPTLVLESVPDAFMVFNFFVKGAKEELN